MNCITIFKLHPHYLSLRIKIPNSGRHSQQRASVQEHLWGIMNIVFHFSTAQEVSSIQSCESGKGPIHLTHILCKQDPISQRAFIPLHSLHTWLLCLSLLDYVKEADLRDHFFLHCVQCSWIMSVPLSILLTIYCKFNVIVTALHLNTEWFRKSNNTRMHQQIDIFRYGYVDIA